jgi:hypothetical protein
MPSQRGKGFTQVLCEYLVSTPAATTKVTTAATTTQSLSTVATTSPILSTAAKTTAIYSTVGATSPIAATSPIGENVNKRSKLMINRYKF